MAMIHISRSGATLGIYDEAKVREGLRTGEFIATDLGWMEGMATWRPLSELENFHAPAATPSPPLVPETTRSVATPATESSPLMAGKTEPLAIWSFVLSIVALLCCAFVFGIPAVICGHLALSNIRKSPHLKGGGLATAGLVIGYLGMALWLIYIVFFGGIAVLQGIAEGVGN